MPKLLTDYIQKSATALEISFQHFETLITEMQTSGALTEKEADEKRTTLQTQLMRDAPEIVETSVSNLTVNAASKDDILKKIDEWFWQPQFTTDDNQALDESFLSLSNHVNQRSIALQNKVNAALEKAVDILRGVGELSLSVRKRLKFDVINQVTDERLRVELPILRAGGQSLHHSQTIVDRILKETDCQATIFQRMDKGLVRIATTITTLDEKRAIHTFIPNDSPVVQAILRKETFRGSAFVVNNWYATAYIPLEIEGKIAAILYVGAKEYLPQINQRISNVRFRTMLEQLADVHFPHQNDASLIEKLIHFFSEAQQTASGNPFIELALKELTVVLKQVKEQRKALKPHLTKHPLSKVTDFIHKNFDKSISIDELVALANVSKPTLNRYFKDNYALSPLDYINNERLNQAVILIETGKKSVAEVGRIVGINDASYFIKLFRQRFGMTPRQYFTQNSPNKLS